MSTLIYDLFNEIFKTGNWGVTMTMFKVKFGSKEIILKIGLGVKIPKLGINIR